MLWMHADGRSVRVQPEQLGTQRILRKAGFKPLDEDEPAPPGDEAGLDGLAITRQAAAALEAAGFGTLAALRQATDEDLLAVRGIGQKTLEAIRNGL